MTSPDPTTPVRVAVVGAMGFGRIHLRALRAMRPAALLCGVVDPRPLEGEALELAGDVPAYHSLTSLLADQVPDVVAIASPIPTHAPLAVQAVHAGCHVLVEKPPTATWADYQQLLAVAAETDRAVQVGFQADGSTAYDRIAEIVAAGEIGEVRGVGAVGAWVREPAYYARAAWAGRRRLDGVEVVDGVVTNPFAHAVQAALRVAGARRAERVETVEVELFHANDIEADDTSAVRVVTTDGLPVALGLTLCAAADREPEVLVHGTAGRIVLRYKIDEIEVVTARGTRTSTASTTGLLPNLVAHVRDRSVPLLSGLADAGGFMRVMEAVRTAPDPAQIDVAHVEHVGGRVQVRDAELWCRRVAEELRTFTGLGAPWARDAAAR
ncbi:Gfo/Idh/MocA family protein [Georgenia alba]|uniref:Gfo/Idh/MocA family protein n=1 Tax=Georgenia alba TaxID=2233858 RepID=A0ABW2Q738_9MICO